MTSTIAWLDGNLIVGILVPNNPKKEDTYAHRAFPAYIDGMTIIAPLLPCEGLKLTGLEVSWLIPVGVARPSAEVLLFG